MEHLDGRVRRENVHRKTSRMTAAFVATRTQAGTSTLLRQALGTGVGV
ncbi:hypothetical protein PC129_g10074 [Phytophthora cactorum]|uniref:Uncharacterized protein n=1 Tax=Phytophthora cactorum TaxID=29920 RepID=A0A8T1I2J6_9STRA|nr:hypothetical protein Pcac1_g6950 [Phytophthora cactorum]KAG2886406.1 hypothetical protein PC114_g19277 [Phytophthora cactorum]KAG2927774.1 hypothetical protein PC117_g14498 [Phytophthora cactorum]KAG3006908.1 hypothetical protein PC119_g14781 [Phytophthora cactorum]KAG3030093.1 hypothetical protein PC120_g3984 [Phytophthora cactorum]